MIKAIIFDCFGVLTTDTWRAFIDNLPQDANSETAREAHRTYAAGLITKKQATQQIKEATGRDYVEIEDVFSEEVTKNTALLDYIREVKKDYRIGLLSNVATPWITDAFLTEEEQELFDAMILSYEVGITKPDPRIFMLACERLRVGPHEAVLVDDMARYCEAAKAEGLQAVTYNDLTQMKHDLEAILSTS